MRMMTSDFNTEALKGHPPKKSKNSHQRKARKKRSKQKNKSSLTICLKISNIPTVILKEPMDSNNTLPKDLIRCHIMVPFLQIQTEAS